MKTLKDLGLCKKSRKKVEDWLQEWLDLFIKQANGKQGWPYRADFENKDNVKQPIFFFTDCKDILEKDSEARAHESNLIIRSRKRKVLLQLLIKTLMGKENICDNIKCGHCGFSPCWIEGLEDGTGHWTYCPKCKKLEVQVFPEGFDTCIETIKLEIAENTKLRGFSSPAPILDVTATPLMKINPKCKDLIKEIQAYKYKKNMKVEFEFSTLEAARDYKKFEKAMDEVKKIVNPDPRLIDVITEKRKVPKGAWSTIIKGNKRCPKCNHKMTAMPIYTGVSLEPLDGWHCPKCKYCTVKK